MTWVCIIYCVYGCARLGFLSVYYLMLPTHQPFLNTHNNYKKIKQTPRVEETSAFHTNPSCTSASTLHQHCSWKLQNINTHLINNTLEHQHFIINPSSPSSTHNPKSYCITLWKIMYRQRKCRT